MDHGIASIASKLMGNQIILMSSIVIFTISIGKLYIYPYLIFYLFIF